MSAGRPAADPSPDDPRAGERPGAGLTVHVVCSLFHPDRAPGERAGDRAAPGRVSLLDRQLESILEQSHGDLRVWLRDDAAEPATARRIDAWRRRDSRIELAPGARGHLGTRASYDHLTRTALEHGAEWIAFADQDDEWRPDHLANSLALADRRARAAAAAAPPGTRPPMREPLLVHGDLELIDADGATIAASAFAHQRVRHAARDPLGVLAVQNFVTGCATLINRPLAEWALPIPEAAIMHDWWIALCAAAAGSLLARDHATVRYRQHAHNQIGAQSYRDVVRELGRRTFGRRRHSIEPLLETVRQCAALRERIEARSEEAWPDSTAERMRAAAALLDDYLDLYRPEVSRLRRTLGMLRLGIRRQDRLLDLSLKAKLLTTPVALGADLDDPAHGPR